MPYIDDRFRSADRNIKAVSPRKIEKHATVSLPQEIFSEVEDIESLKFKSNVKSVYNDICKKIDLNEQIRPELKFETLGVSGAAGGFDVVDGKIYFDDFFIKGLEKYDIAFIIRHELEHVKQFHDMERMLGVENFMKLMISKIARTHGDKTIKINTDYYKKVEQVLGKIDKNSPDGIRAQKYIDAFNKYPDFMTLRNRNDICELKKIFLFAKEFIVNYKFNFLETSANKAAKKFLKTFKV